MQGSSSTPLSLQSAPYSFIYHGGGMSQIPKALQRHLLTLVWEGAGEGSDLFLCRISNPITTADRCLPSFFLRTALLGNLFRFLFYLQFKRSVI